MVYKFEDDEKFTKSDLEYTSNKSFGWGFIAGFITLFFLLGSILVLGLMLDI